MGIDTADDASMRAFSRTTVDDVFTMTLNPGGGGVVTNSRLASGSGAMRPVTSEIAEATAGRVAGKEVAEEALEKGRSKPVQDVWGKGWIQCSWHKTRSKTGFGKICHAGNEHSKSNTHRTGNI